MTDASGGHDQYPGQPPTTADELLAALTQSIGATEGNVTLAEGFTTTLGGITTQLAGLELQDGAAVPASGGVPQLHDRLGQEWAGEADDQVRKILEGRGSPRLHGVLDHVFGDGEGELTGLPPAEQLRQVVKLDALIRLAAGLPIVVLKPGKTWIDIGLLETPLGGVNNNVGLQRDDNLREATSSIVLPVHKSLTIDVRTTKELALEAQGDDRELYARRQRPENEPGEPTRPILDPLHASMLLTAEDVRDATVDGTTTHVLVGYDQLYRTLNVLGFDMSQTGNEDEAQTKFYAALRIQKLLEKFSIDIDLDFINGYLTYSIDMLNREMEEGGPLKTVSSVSQKLKLAGMEHKLNLLTDSGWLSRPPSPETD